MGGDRPLRLLQLTDSHLRADPAGSVKGWPTRDSLELVIGAALDGGERPDAILATGDLSQDGTPDSYLHIRDLLGHFGVPVFCIPGNHDDPHAMQAILSEPPFHYCGDHGFGNWRLVMLATWDGDRGGGCMPDAELQRLARVLDASVEPHLLVVLHHHPVPMQSWLDKVPLDNPDDLFAITDRCARVRGILWGHVHQAHDSVRQGVRLLATPSTCFQFVPGAPASSVDPHTGPGWRWLELKPDGTIDTRVEWAPKPPGFGS
jgi:3',5'-cyclic-AMP phosphodiesterase